MKTANLNRLPNRSANLGRTGHDMSQEFTFTASTGMILPTYQDYLNAGETEYYSGDLICRTQPLVTAAMCDVDLYLDWFFVPAQMLFTLFGSKRWMTNDLLSSFYDASVIDNDTMPLFNIDSYLAVANADLAKPVLNFYNANYSLQFECLGKSQFRLANHLGFNPYGIFKGNSSAATTYTTEDNPNVFPLFALAYQAIYQDYFRLPLDSFERRDIKAFNVDADYTATTTPVSYTALAAKAQLFCLRYRPRHLDYFTSIKASPMFSAMNSLGGSSNPSTPAQILQRVDNYLDNKGVFNSNESGSTANSAAGSVNASQTQVNSPTVVGSATGRVTTGQLRSMFAVEKLMRVIGRAKMDYDSQVLAHFGFQVPHDVKHQLSHLKTQHSIIHIGEVISTADTYQSGSGSSSGSALGAIGGKGYGIIKSGDKPFKFTAPCDGVIMCTFSAVPRLRYYGTFDKQNVLTNRLSFYQPEFDKLGMQPLYHYEAFHFRSSSSDNTDRLGWQFRYEQWKRKYDKVSEAFALPSNYGQLNQNSAWVVSLSPYATVNDLSGTSSFGVGWTNAGLVCKPTELNSAMVVPYTTQWNTAYLTNPQTMFYTDPFICQFRANVKKVSVMSAYGEPDLGTF